MCAIGMCANGTLLMFPTDSNLSLSVINSVFLEKSSQYRNNAITFYTDGSKLDKDWSEWRSV